MKVIINIILKFNVINRSNIKKLFIFYDKYIDFSECFIIMGEEIRRKKNKKAAVE